MTTCATCTKFRPQVGTSEGACTFVLPKTLRPYGGDAWTHSTDMCDLHIPITDPAFIPGSAYLTGEYKVQAWKAVAVALHSALADEVCEPTHPANVAYNFARNGNYAAACEHLLRSL